MQSETPSKGDTVSPFKPFFGTLVTRKYLVFQSYPDLRMFNCFNSTNLQKINKNVFLKKINARDFYQLTIITVIK